jgi:TIR domain
MYACLATATDDVSLTQAIEHVVSQIGLGLTRLENENGSTVNLQPKTRQTVRSARVFIAALAGESLRGSSIFYGIGIAQSGRVPVVVVGADPGPLSLRGPMLGEIPEENIFLRTSSGFPTNLETRIRELVLVAPGLGSSVKPNVKASTFDVFLSYTAADGKYAEEFLTFLRQYNVRFWDFGTNPREYDVDFGEEVENAIRQSKVFVAVITPNWRHSQWTQDEFKFARRLGRKPVLLEFEETGPVLVLSSLTSIDCRTSRSNGFHKMLRRLDELLTEGE